MKLPREPQARIDALIAALAVEDPDHRARRRLLADPDKDVRIAALDQLALTRNPTAHALIESAYGDASEKVRDYARWAAAEWRKDRAKERRAAARNARRRSPQSGESC